MAFLSDLFCFVLGAEKIRTRGIRASDAAKRSAEAGRERGGRQGYHAQPFHSLQACPHQGRTSYRNAGVALPLMRIEENMFTGPSSALQI